MADAPTEKQLSEDLRARLEWLERQDRCTWRPEVRMVCLAHASKGAPTTLRIDYVANLDGILVGFEVKKPPETPADLGRALVQCAQYSQGIIGVATVDRVPPTWIGQSLLATFLVSDASFTSEHVQEHGHYAHRLFGPANVGFMRRTGREPRAFELYLCAERAWSDEWGWHRGIIGKTARSGNGRIRVADVESVTVPERWAHTRPFRFR